LKKSVSKVNIKPLEATNGTARNNVSMPKTIKTRNDSAYMARHTLSSSIRVSKVQLEKIQVPEKT